MKIGILTVHRAYNYGSVLQCYALQEYLKSLGHEVWVIDYHQPWTEAVYKPFSFYYINKQIKHPITILKYVKSYSRRKKLAKQRKLMFSSFLKNFRLTSPCFSSHDIPQNFDRYIIGSDQLWSHSCFGGEDKVYLGFFKHAHESKIIGYAISSNEKSLNIFGKNRLHEIISNFDFLSVREKFVADFLNEKLDVHVPIVLDPTLLTDSNLWNCLINEKWKSKNYIAIYQARNVVGNRNYLREKAQIFANCLKCEIIDLSQMTYSVEDFISIIKYAKYVLTTSFHATVFSLIMETPCYSIKLEDGFDGRYVDLLNSIGANIEVVNMNFVPREFCVDFKLLKKQLIKLRRNSEAFIEKSLS